MRRTKTSRTSASFFFFNATAATAIYTLSLHDALPICPYRERLATAIDAGAITVHRIELPDAPVHDPRSEEHTSELQSHVNLVCRLLLEKKKKVVGSLAGLGGAAVVLPTHERVQLSPGQ